jgi:hypothetical protein
MCYHPCNPKKRSLNTGEILSEHILEMNDRPFCVTCANAPSGTNIENIEKMAEKRGTGMFVYEEKLYFCH